mgnify:CR=1 FL=1
MSVRKLGLTSRPLLSLCLSRCLALGLVALVGVGSGCDGTEPPDDSGTPVVTDSGAPDDTDAGNPDDTDAGNPQVEEPELLVDDQDLDPNDEYAMTAARVVVPAVYVQGAWLVIYDDDNGAAGAYVGKHHFDAGTHSNTAMMLDIGIDQPGTFHAILREPTASGGYTSSGTILTTSTGTEMVVSFQMRDVVAPTDAGMNVDVDAGTTPGDDAGSNVDAGAMPVEAADLIVDDQEIDPNDAYTLQVARVVVPASVSQGAWLAIYVDDNGAAGSIRGKHKFDPGTHVDTAITLDIGIDAPGVFHAILREGTVSGSFSSNRPVLTDADGDDVAVQFTMRDPVVGGEDGGIIVAPDDAVLFVDDQTLAAPYNEVVVSAVSLASDELNAGTVEVHFVGGANDGDLAGSAAVPAGQTHENLLVALTERVVGDQALIASLHNANGQPVLDVDGTALEANFSAAGDTEDPELIVNSQKLDPGDLYAMVVDHAIVPERITQGAWLAVYDDDNGALGTYMGKHKFEPGFHSQTSITLTFDFERTGLYHAVMREATAAGSWSSSAPILVDASGQEMATQFHVDAIPFQPALEIEDQTLVNQSVIDVKFARIPVEFTGSSRIAIYDDNGSLLGATPVARGTHNDIPVGLDAPLQGDHTLHAMLHDDSGVITPATALLTSTGAPLVVTFRVGAADLSYIEAPDFTTTDPRHLVLSRAYSYDKPAWVVLTREDPMGGPATLVAKRRVLQRYAGNVHFYGSLHHFDDVGTVAEYVTEQPGTRRRSARGEDTLRVSLYEEDPADGEFTWTPGGTEDVPVLDAMGAPITADWNVTVASSIDNSQKDSGRYYDPCPLSQHYNNPTTLPVDCRCHVNVESLDFPECKLVIADGLNMSYGTGPRARTQNFGTFRSGFVDSTTNELIGLVYWKDHQTVWPENSTTIDVGAVVAIDPETRARRLIGGRFNHPDTGIEDLGTGPVLSYPFQVQEGPDGNYYIASYGYVRIGASLTPTVDIIRMSPATGDREYVWRSNHLGYNFDNQQNPYGHCANGRAAGYEYFSVQVGRKAFGIDDNGDFYLSYAHNGNTPTSDGIGILKIGSDGSTCDFVTRTKVGADNLLYQGQSIGTGPEPQAGPYKGMLIKDGKIFASTELTGDLYEIDIATGNRTALHVKNVDDTNSGSSGTHVVWDHHRNIIWQAGFSNATLLYDPDTGTSEPLWCAENYRDYKGMRCQKPAAWGNNGLLIERGYWIHPTDPRYAFVVNGAAIMRVDLVAGSSEIFSY